MPEAITDAPEALEQQARLNQETALIAWRELQRFFAQGRVVEVRAGLDLIEIAHHAAADDVARFQSLIAAGDLAPVGDDRARTWLAADASVWAVVVRPWIFVQDRSTRPAG